MSIIIVKLLDRFLVYFYFILLEIAFLLLSKQYIWKFEVQIILLPYQGLLTYLPNWSL